MMKSNKALARKILCGLLAAGVLGVSGSALAEGPVPKGDTAPASYGSSNNGAEVNVNDTYVDGTINGGVDIAISANGGKSTFSGKQISITANKSSIKKSFYSQVFKKDEDGNLIKDGNGKPIPDKDSNGNNVYEYNGKDSYWDQKGLEANKGKIFVNGTDSVIVKAENQKGNAYAIDSLNSDALVNVISNSINLESKASGNAIGIRASSKSNVSIGEFNTSKVILKSESNTSAYNIQNMGKEANVSLKGKLIELISESNGTAGYGVQNSSESQNGSGDNIGDENTEKITINTIANSGQAYAAKVDKKSNTSFNAKSIGFIVKAKEQAVGIDAAGGSTIIKVNATDDVNIDVESKDNNANAVSDSYAKTEITANSINLKAKTNAKGKIAYTVLSSNNGNITLNATNIRLDAEGDGAVAIRAPKKSNFVIGGSDSTIDIIANAQTAARGVSVTDGSSVVIGGEKSVVNVTANAKNGTADGIFNVEGKDVTINGSELNVNVSSSVDKAVGIHVQNNYMADETNRATVNVNTENTTINADTALSAMSHSILNVNSNLVTNGKNAILTRGNSDVNINTDGKHTTQLNGDIVFDYDKATSNTGIDSNVNVNLNGEGSYWTGNTKAQWNSDSGKPDGKKMAVSHMTLNVENGAQWNPTYIKDDGSTTDNSGVQGIALNNLKLANGTVNLDSSKLNEDAPVKVENLSGNGTIVTDSLDNKLSISNKAAESELTVNGTKEVTDAIASGKAKLQDLANVVKGKDDKSAADTVTSDANDIIGGYSAKVDGEGNVQANTVKTIENTTNRAISDMANISLMTWRAENNDMNKRLGELRDSKGEHGAWARMARGESKYGAQNVKNQYNYYQVGYDEKLSVDPNWTVGVALTRTEGNSTFATGSGENKHTGVAVYGSYLNDNGSFIDLIAKYARMDNEYKTIGAGVGDADYKANGYSLSAEYGKRFTKDNGFWIEPQVELTYGTVGSVDYLTSKGYNVHQDSVDSLVARLGFSLGKDIKQGNVYVRASYLYDFDGETKATMSGAGTASFEQDLGGGWWEVGVGTNINLSDATHLYFDVEKTYGGNVATPWQWNAGVRWSF